MGVTEKRCVRCHCYRGDHPVVLAPEYVGLPTPICAHYVRPAPWWLRALNAVLRKVT